MSETISTSKTTFTETELHNAITKLGLKLSAKEMSALARRERVSLESRPMSEFAKLLSQAEAQAKQDDPKADFSFKAIQHELMSTRDASHGDVPPAGTRAACTGTKVVKIGRCSLRVHWPPGISVCCQF